VAQFISRNTRSSLELFKTFKDAFLQAENNTEFFWAISAIRLEKAALCGRRIGISEWPPGRRSNWRPTGYLRSSVSFHPSNVSRNLLHIFSSFKTKPLKSGYMLLLKTGRATLQRTVRTRGPAVYRTCKPQWTCANKRDTSLGYQSLE
jgi:hypothetical protein